MRKVQQLHFENYNQPIKPVYANCYSVQMDCGYINTFPKTFTRKAPDANIWAKVDETDLETVNIFGSMQSGARLLSSQSVQFIVSYYAQGDSWQKTVVDTIAGTPIATGGFKASVLISEFPRLIGDYTVVVDASFLRRGKNYHFQRTLNHLGIFILSAYNKTKISFLEVTKADE